MSETTMASLAVQRRVYAALDTHLTDPVTSAVVPVYDQVPETAGFPYVQLCSAAETPRNTFQHTGRTVVFQIDVWTRSGADAAADGWYQAKQIAGQIDVLLDATIPAASDGWTFVSCLFDSSKESQLSDGMTRRVTLEYRVLLETTTP